MSQKETGRRARLPAAPGLFITIPETDAFCQDLFSKALKALKTFKAPKPPKAAPKVSLVKFLKRGVKGFSKETSGTA